MKTKNRRRMIELCLPEGWFWFTGVLSGSLETPYSSEMFYSSFFHTYLLSPLHTSCVFSFNQCNQCCNHWILKKRDFFVWGYAQSVWFMACSMLLNSNLYSKLTFGGGMCCWFQVLGAFLKFLETHMNMFFKSIWCSSFFHEFDLVF